MGNILARFKKKKDTEEVLGLLEDEIIYIESMTSNTSPINYYKIIFHSVVLYGLISILYYLKIISNKLFKNSYIIAILATYPVIAHFYYKFDVWYYNRKIVAYNVKLTELRREKKKILDEVMEKETFKVAREILEKYAPHQLQSMTSQNFINQTILSSTNNRPQFTLPGRQINRGPNMVVGPPPARMSSAIKPRLALSRPLIPRDRSIFDRLADTVLGDGPQNRYALICRTCGSHNGMARKEEFDYLAYRCAYCFQWNPSLKPRPQLATIYDNGAIKQNGSVTIEEVTDQPSFKFGDSNRNENVNSEQKDSIINIQNSDASGPTIEEMEDVQQSDNLNSKNDNLEEPIDNSEVHY